MWDRDVDEDPTTIYDREEETTDVASGFALRARGTAPCELAPEAASSVDRPTWAEGVVPRPRRLAPLTTLERALAALELDGSLTA